MNRYTKQIGHKPMIIAAGILFLAYPFLIQLFVEDTTFLLTMGFDICRFAALACSWNVIGGFGRQISWTHSAFLGIGAYTSMLMFMRLNTSPWIGMLAGMLVAGVLALLIGAPTFKLNGVFFSLATIATCQIVRLLLLNYDKFTGGASGLIPPYQEGTHLWAMKFDSGPMYYYLMFLCMVVCQVVMILVDRSRLGYYLKAISNDQIAAESLGIKSHHVKMKALVISAMMASAVGTIFAFKNRFIEPDTMVSHDLSLRIGVTVILGGIATIWGPIIGAVVLVPVLQITYAYGQNFFNAGLSQILYGMILILLVIFLPNGLLSLKDKFAKQPGEKRNGDGGELPAGPAEHTRKAVQKDGTQ